MFTIVVVVWVWYFVLLVVTAQRVG